MCQCMVYVTSILEPDFRYASLTEKKGLDIAVGDKMFPTIYHIDGLAQDCSNSIANALGLLQSCPKQSI